MQTIQLAVLARLLTAADFGVMSIALIVVAFAQSFADFGLSNAIIHFQDATRRELSTLYWLNLIVGILLFAAVFVAAPWIAAGFGKPAVEPVVRLVSFMFLLLPIGQQFQVLCERDLRFRRLAAVETIAVAIGAAAGITCALRGQGVHSLVWALLASTSARALMLATIGWREWRPMLAFYPRECGRFIQFGAFQIAERFLNTLGQQLDKIVIGASLDETTMGYYALANRFITLPYQVINPVFTRVAFPVFSRVQDDIDRMRKGFLEMIALVGATMAPIYVGLAVLSGPFVAIQLGPDFGPVVPLMRILAVLGFLYSIGNPTGSVLLARGRSDVAFYLNVIRTILFAGALWLGVRYGVRGVACSLVLVVTIVFVPVGFRLRRWLMQMTAAEFVRVLAPAVFFAMVSGAAALATMWGARAGGAAAQLATGAATGLAVYVLLARRFWRHQYERVIATLRN